MSERKIAVIGTGYVGLVSGTSFAHAGHDVTCCDVDQGKIERLRQADITIYEPGLDVLVSENMRQGRLHFTTNIDEAVQQSAFIFIAVGTPMSESGEADMTYIQSAARMIGKAINGYKIVVTKSTVPVGTGRKLEQWIREEAPHARFDVVSNPEFLREGSAVYDSLNMERVIIGASQPSAADAVAQIYEPFGSVIVKTTLESAEMIKYASNTFLATKISFINAIANLCEHLGADVEEVAHGMGLDGRIGHRFLQAGIGYGGSCFPKDTYALQYMAREQGYDFSLLDAVIETNERQRLIVIEKLTKALGNVKGKRIAVLGLSFKPNTDDMRDAPSLTVVPIMTQLGATVRVYDPIAAEEARKHFGDSVTYCESVYEAVEQCDACIVLTEWETIVKADWQMIRSAMAAPVLIDGRNCWPLEDMHKAGFYYDSIGRQLIPSYAHEKVQVTM
ncbi:UDP-glucose dehydrogenase family protein [Paenibacillus taiwanensis]|uniref:UDP-glucose dehydrogenase family protein n=1 Tax=Paenibacillus taiwanensis TaxID=401638 RepID=UPI0004068E78|nr:UDP-glucose/GDP-mannose dehydrogenase family protein [Paenibacillus taiwanensis]